MPPEIEAAALPPGLYSDPVAFSAALGQFRPRPQAATARAAFFVRPDFFDLAEESTQDNRYMVRAPFDRARAQAQHAALVAAVAEVIPTQVFPGLPDAPDAVFPNNVFAAVPGRLLIGAMRHAVRQREAQRDDIPRWFQGLGYSKQSLIEHGVVAELTGSLVPDRAAGIGYFGLSERMNPAGAARLYEAFGCELGLAFELAPGEYHTNVVMSVLAGRALVIHRDSFADPRVADAIAKRYAPQVIWIDDQEKSDFVGNCIALSDDTVFMSARADRSLSHRHREQLAAAGFTVRAVELDEVEKAGGSLRCCVAEVF